MKKIIKKAFTLVELLVVIAILALLATVSIVGYSSFTKKAKLTKDNSILSELNNIITDYKALNSSYDINTPSELAEALSEHGIDVTKLTPASDDCHYGFDVENDKFVIFDDSDKSNPILPEDYTLNGDSQKIFVFADSQATKTDYEGTYGIYRQATCTDLGNSVDIVGSYDDGVHTSTTINYTNTSGTSKDVVIRTNSLETTLTIEDNSDGKIYHYDTLGNLVVTKCGYACYYEYGTTAYAKVTEGKVVAKTDGEITVLYAVDNKVAAQEDGGTIGVAYCTGTASEYDTFSNDKGGNVVFDGTKSATEIDTAGNAVVSNKIDAQVQEETVGAVVRVGTKGYEKFSDALDAAAEIGGTVTLLEDTYCYGPQVAQGKNVTLDLNGKKLHVGVSVNNDSSISDSCVKVNYGATLTIKDSVGTGKIWSNANASKNYPTIQCTEGGSLVVDSGIIESKNYYAIATAQDSYHSDSIAKITINGGSIYSENSTANGAIQAKYKSELYVYDGTIGTNGSVKSYIGISTTNNNSCVLKIEGGTICGSSNSLNLSSTTLTVSGGTFNGGIGGSYTATITDGTFVNEKAYVGSMNLSEANSCSDTKGYIILDSTTSETYYKYVAKSSDSDAPYYVKKNSGSYYVYYSEGDTLDSLNMYSYASYYTQSEVSGNSDIKDIYNLAALASGYHYEYQGNSTFKVVAD